MSPSVGQLLELGNGLWTIVCFSLTIFLTYHIIKVASLRKIMQRRRWLKPPASLQMAIGFLVATFGILVRCAPIWLDRALHGGVLSEGADRASLVVGTAIAVVGFMCVLRVATRPMVGHWPWVMTSVVMAAYVVIWAARL